MSVIPKLSPSERRPEAMTPEEPMQIIEDTGPAAGFAPPPVIRAPEGPTKRKPTPGDIKRALGGFDIPEEDRPPKKKKKKKKPVKKNMGGMMNYSHGGKVRGHGMARGGRPCKMVSMKGS